MARQRVAVTSPGAVWQRRDKVRQTPPAGRPLRRPRPSRTQRRHPGIGAGGPSPRTLNDAREALSHAGGLSPLCVDRLRYNVVTSGQSAGRVDIAEVAVTVRAEAAVAPPPPGLR